MFYKSVPVVLFLVLGNWFFVCHAQVPQMTKQFKEKFMNSTKVCTLKYDVTPGQLLPIMTRDDGESVPEDAKCFMLCIMQEFSMMDEQGNLNEEKVQGMIKTLPRSHFVTVMQNNYKDCVAKGVKNKCEKAFKFVKCVYKRRKQL